MVNGGQNYMLNTSNFILFVWFIVYFVWFASSLVGFNLVLYTLYSALHAYVQHPFKSKSYAF